MIKTAADDYGLITAKKLHQLSAKDLMRIYSHIRTYKGAWLAYRRLKQQCGKQPHQSLTVGDVARWEGWEIADVYKLVQQP